MEKTTAIQAQPLPLNEVLYWPSMKVLAMTQPNAAVFSKASFLRGMVVSMGAVAVIRMRPEAMSSRRWIAAVVDRCRQLAGEQSRGRHSGATSSPGELAFDHDALERFVRALDPI